MNKLDELIKDLENKISKQELVHHTISKSSVGWHIEHTLLTIKVIIEALKNSNPNRYKWKFNIARFFIFTINKIPRGRAQSPASVQPADSFNAETLENHVKIIIEKLKELKNLKPNNYIEHPFFGKLNLKSTVKFIAIHTKHHIDIINDIIKA
ncbi:MAG: DinB family protein [Ginsengibacter sp.]